MRGPGVVTGFVAQVGKRIAFPVVMRAECRPDGGFEIRGPEPRGGELLVQRDYFSEQPGEVGYFLAGEFLSRRVPLCVAWRIQKAPPP
jgi:hypothetical protein